MTWSRGALCASCWPAAGSRCACLRATKARTRCLGGAGGPRGGGAAAAGGGWWGGGGGAGGGGCGGGGGGCWVWGTDGRNRGAPGAPAGRGPPPNWRAS